MVSMDTDVEELLKLVIRTGIELDEQVMLMYTCAILRLIHPPTKAFSLTVYVDLFVLFLLVFYLFMQFSCPRLVFHVVPVSLVPPLFCHSSIQ